MIVIALGANLPSAAGAPEATLKAALDVLAKSGVNPDAVSRFYRSPAWPDPADPPYVNAVARVVTRLPAAELMNLLHAVETSFGRERMSVSKNAPRTLDLDLLDYDGLVREASPRLPHPRLAARSFVLLPLRDIAPDWRHPQTGATLADMLAALGAEANTPKPIP